MTRLDKASKPWDIVPLTERLGDKFGRYKLLQHHMGVMSHSPQEFDPSSRGPFLGLGYHEASGASALC